MRTKTWKTKTWMIGTGLTWTLTLLVGLATPLAAGAQTPPFELEFADAPSIKGAAGGWPLDLRITVAEDRLADIGGFYTDWTRPANDRKILLVTEDPDGCPSWIEQADRARRSKDGLDQGSCQLAERAPWPVDETLIEVTPGRGSLAPALDPCAGRPTVRTFDRSAGANLRLEAIGPCAGDTDGYGRSSRLPGLVLLADRGPGVVTDSDFAAVTPRRVRNLAGFFESFGFLWRNPDREREIRAHMLAPTGLFSKVVAQDGHVTSPPGTGGLPMLAAACPELRATDGGAPRCYPPTRLVLVGGTSLRAFLVKGLAPEHLEDQDGDGVVTADDARAAGYRLLSNEATLEVWEHRGETWLTRDLDGDGDPYASHPFPSSPAKVTDPPP